MPAYLPFLLVGLLAIGLLVWLVGKQRRKQQARMDALERLGFSPCTNRKTWLEETVASIENNRGYRYEVSDPQCLTGEAQVYYYFKRRHGNADQDSVSEEEILFAVKRPSRAGLALFVKPSSLAPGLATRMLGALATGPWDAQPDDLTRLEIPVDLRNTNLLGAIGPPGASLYDLVDLRTLGVVQGLGNVGGMFVRFRDGWCSVSRASAQIPFRVPELIALIRPLLEPEVGES